MLQTTRFLYDLAMVLDVVRFLELWAGLHKDLLDKNLWELKFKRIGPQFWTHLRRGAHQHLNKLEFPWCHKGTALWYHSHDWGSRVAQVTKRERVCFKDI